jgi:hypothetical protein
MLLTTWDQMLGRKVAVLAGKDQSTALVKIAPVQGWTCTRLYIGRKYMRIFNGACHTARLARVRSPTELKTERLQLFLAHKQEKGVRKEGLAGRIASDWVSTTIQTLI